MEMLKQGYSPKEIQNRISVSNGYIYTLKKQMELEQEQEREQVAPELDEVIEADPREFQEAAVERLEHLLDERGARYGSFIGQARIAQQLKNVAHTFAAQQGKTFDVDQAEALDMIFTKIARILNGDPHYADSWIDIAGYAKLVANRLEGKIQ
jgi:hypothetical protein